MADITFIEGSGLADSVFGKTQAPIRRLIEKRGEAYEQESVVNRVFDVNRSENYAEKITTLTAMDGFKPVGEMGAHPWDGMREGFSKTVEHMVWKDRFSLSREMLDDCKLLDMRKRPEGFVAGFYRTRERFGACLLGNAIVGNTTASFGGKSFDCTAADGKKLFATDHGAKVKGAAQSNCYADAFSAEALGKMEIAMQSFRGDNGEMLDIAPDTIVIPNLYALKDAVFAAVGSNLEPTTGNNKYNYHCGCWNIQIWPYLNEFITSGTSPWLLLDSRYNKDVGSLVWQDRTELEVRSEIAENDANVWKGFARFAAGFNDWRGVCVGGVSGGSNL